MMNKSEITLLLGLAAAFDRRTVGEADVEAWHSVLHDVDFEDAKLAVKGHFRVEPDRYLMPAHVVQGVKELRRWRMANTPMPPAPSELVNSHGYPDPTDHEKYAAWRQWQRDTIEAIKDGRYSPVDEATAVAAIEATTAKPEPVASGAWWDN